MAERIPYDEFSMFAENASEYAIPFAGPPVVRRESVEVPGGRKMSALVWGTGEPEVVFLHGGAQNAHTWDTVVLALGARAGHEVPAVCIDLPGHGHSDAAGPGDADAGPLAGEADDMARVIAALAPRARAVVGMSLGGLTSIAVSRRHPHLVARLVLVDVTPGLNPDRTARITAFVNGPATFASFDDLLARTIEHNPTRSVTSLRRGILHNALQCEDGSWVWRYRRESVDVPGDSQRPDLSELWEAVSDWGATGKPLLLVRGMRPESVVSDDDENELLRRVPHARVEHVEEAGHSVQGDAPLELAALVGGCLG